MTRNDWKWCLLAAIAAVGCGGVSSDELTETEQDIIGGTRVESLREARFMASVERRDWFDGQLIDGWACGGTIIAPRWVLTAAHCVTHYTEFTPINLNRLSVVVHDLNLAKVDATSRIAVTQVVVKPQYTGGVDHDVALLKLERAVDPSWALTLDRGGLLKPGTPTRVYGWGDTAQEIFEPGSESAAQTTHEIPSDWGGSNALLSAQLKTLSNAECNRMYIDGVTALGMDPSKVGYPTLPLTGEVFCAESADSTPRDHCYGDSGGPLVAWNPTLKRRVLVGVVNGALGCADPRFPGINARVDQNLGFIQDHTGL